MALSYLDMETVLMKELRLYHHPVAVTFLFTDKEIADFARQTPYHTPVKPLSFCQWEIAARMQGKTVLGEKKDLSCLGGLVSFGWKEGIDPAYIKTLTRYCADDAQLARFIQVKPHMEPEALKAVAVGPLGQAKVKPHVVQFCCDTKQAYHLSVDYMAATDTPVLRPFLTGTSASCGGSVFCWQEQTFNMCPGCAGNYNSGKLERGEINVFIPGNHIEGLVNRLLARIENAGSAALGKPGEPFPGSDVCKNCPQIIFKKAQP